MDTAPKGQLPAAASSLLGALSLVVGSVCPPAVGFNLPGSVDDTTTIVAIALPSAIGLLMALVAGALGGVALARNRFRSWHAALAVIGLCLAALGALAALGWMLAVAGLFSMAAFAWH